MEVNERNLGNWCWQDDRMPIWMNKGQLMTEKDYG